MPPRAAQVNLGAAALGRHRHVCAVFDGEAALAEELASFVVEGLANGEQVLELAEDPASVLAAVSRRMDVGAAISSGQLDVRPWSTSYVADDRFRASRMLAYVRRYLRTIDWQAYPRARLIGVMDWAVEGVDGVDELLEYEVGLTRILARPRVIVVCAYDARRHPPDRLRAILAAHDAALVEGALRDAVGATPSPRDRILAAAGVLFAENGVARTGVDTLIEAAGVAKATFYRHFPAKDDLVVAWLQAPDTQWFDRLGAAAEERAMSPRDVVPRLFEVVAEWLESEDYLGCPYLNAATEVAGLAHPAADIIREQLRRIDRFLEAAIAAAGHPEPAEAAREVHALLAGAIMLGVATRSSASALAARDAAVQLLERRKR